MIYWLNLLLVQYFQAANLRCLAYNCYKQNVKLLDYILKKVNYAKLSPDQIKTKRHDEIELQFITALSDSDQKALAKYLRRENGGGTKQRSF